MPIALTSRVRQLLPSAQVVRYLLVGAGNTVFGYGCFSLFTWLFVRAAPAHPGLAASAATVVAGVTNITVSFLGYKLFVFRSKGRFLPEYLRSFVVYLPTMAFSAVAIAPLTAFLRHVLPSQQQRAPYLAGALLTALTVCTSFLGHKYFSFRKKPETLE